MGINKRFFNFYYLLVLVFGLYNIYLTITNPLKPSQIIGKHLAVSTYFNVLLGLIIFLLSITAVVMIIRRKSDKFDLIFPAFYILYIVVYITIIPLLIVKYIVPIENALIIVDKLSIGDKITFFISLFSSVIMLYRINKRKV